MTGEELVFIGGPKHGDRVSVRSDLDAVCVLDGGAQMVYYRKTLVFPDGVSAECLAMDATPATFQLACDLRASGAAF